MGATQDTEEHKKQLRAEALVGRAFEYLTLVNACLLYTSTGSA